MFSQLEKINQRPEPWAYYTAQDLWDDDYVSRQMLDFHLNGEVDLASRNTDFVEKSAAWIISRFNLGPGVRVCDFGCGPGLYTTRFARTGAKVTGLDFSRNSIRYAQEKATDEGLDIQYRLGNYLDFSSDDKYDLITMIFADFCPLSPEQRQRLLAIVARHLADGGQFFMDVLTTSYFNQAEEEQSYEVCPKNGFWGPDPYYIFLNTWKYNNLNLVLGKHTVVEEQRMREIFNWLQCFSNESLSEEFQAAGLTISDFFSDVAGSPFQEDGAEMAVLAQKS